MYLQLESVQLIYMPVRVRYPQRANIAVIICCRVTFGLLIRTRRQGTTVFATITVCSVTM